MKIPSKRQQQLLNLIAHYEGRLPFAKVHDAAMDAQLGALKRLGLAAEVVEPSGERFVTLTDAGLTYMAQRRPQPILADLPQEAIDNTMATVTEAAASAAVHLLQSGRGVAFIGLQSRGVEGLTGAVVVALDGPNAELLRRLVAVNTEGYTETEILDN